MKPIVDGVYGFTGMIAGQVYEIRDADGLTLIDTGLGRLSGRIVRQMAAAGFGPGDLKRILITHAHIDHGGGAYHLQQLSGAQVLVSAMEAGAMRGTDELPRPKNRRFSVMPKQFFKPSKVDRELHDGDEIPGVLGGLVAVATPGHTLGHLSFWSPTRKILFTGDVILHTLGISLPMGPVSADMALNRQSVSKIAALAPDALLFGHGPAILTDAAARLNAFVERRGIA